MSGGEDPTELDGIHRKIFALKAVWPYQGMPFHLVPWGAIESAAQALFDELDTEVNPRAAARKP